MASLVMWAFRAMTAAQSQHQFGQATYLRATLATQYEVARRLLGNGEEDPRALGWLAGTGVRAAQLALWSRPPLGNPDADRELEVVGTFGGPRRPAPLADGAPQDGPQPPARPLGEQGALSGPRQFPPADLLALADPGQGEVTMLLPVQLANRDWGLVAAVGPVDSEGTSGREGINQWASLLAVALERQEVIDSLANAYARERALSDEVRLGAERYALAAEAASGGLWDWDVAGGRVYYAPRWAAMLGWPESAITPSIHEWFDRVHPEDLGNLRSAIDAHASATKPELEIEHRIRHRDGTYKWVLCRALAVRGPDGAVRRIVGSLTNVDERKQLEERLRHDALYDALTGLPNRTLFAARVHQAVARSQTGATRHEFAVLFLDLDGFKLVNDSLGHVVGDALLAKVAERITSGIRPSDTASRFGGDEFAVLVDEIADGDDPVKVAKRVLAELAAPLFVDGYAIAVTASVGIASSDNRYETAEDVLRDADTAMYHAKAEGKNRYAIFDNRMHLRAVHQLRLEAELRPALGRRN
jgi:diguanylate cyclase (GGDEF)-like protein/PAS domain S-box-containing protein